MVSGTCFHGKCVFLRVEHKLARAHVRIDDLARFDTFLAPAVDMLIIPDDFLAHTVDMLVILWDLFTTFWHMQSMCWSFCHFFDAFWHLQSRC